MQQLSLRSKGWKKEHKRKKLEMPNLAFQYTSNRPLDFNAVGSVNKCMGVKAALCVHRINYSQLRCTLRNNERLSGNLSRSYVTDKEKKKQAYLPVKMTTPHFSRAARQAGRASESATSTSTPQRVFNCYFVKNAQTTLFWQWTMHRRSLKYRLDGLRRPTDLNATLWASDYVYRRISELAKDC